MENAIDTYLHNTNIAALYPQYNEVIAVVYHKIRKAFRDGADSFIATKNEVVWSKEGMRLGRYYGPAMPPRTVPYSEALQEILRYDDFMQKHIEVDSRVDETLICRLIY